MERGQLLYLCGLPQSGKSTWANNWVREVLAKPLTFAAYDPKMDITPIAKDGLPGIFKGHATPACQISGAWDGKPLPTHPPARPRVVIGGDDFRTGLHGMTYLPEAEPFVFASMDVAILSLLNRGFDVIVDETCSTENTLRRYLRIDLNAKPVFIETSAEVCKERAIATGKHYLLGPIDRMAAQLSHLRSNWDEIHARLTEYVKMRLTHDNHC